MPWVPGAGFSLKFGSRGQGVEYLQQRLSALGYYTGRISGHFGPKTKYAVKQYQKDCRVEANGIVDELFWQSLG